ncbi:TRAP transporter small permease [Vreelandella andesensis]|uniref:TRAP transporter small permease protein n=1 Tax=Vreelandella andesensis TaxID=447567 RepID=A0A3S0Y289_9GAMM|nr:TRAP transporter small permease [Halomonas andesensis]RUR30400.1 TRAP transporter small permease [Halomonas andesensis]
MKLLRFINRFEEILASLGLAFMVILISMQVFFRYVLGSSLGWSEELSRYVLIWAVYIGCSFAAKEDRHLEVTFIRSLLGPRARRFVISLSYIVTLAFCGFCVIWGIEMLNFLERTGQRTQTLGVSIYWVYLSLPVGMALMGIRILHRLWLVGIKGQLPDTNLIDKTP